MRGFVEKAWPVFQKDCRWFRATLDLFLQARIGPFIENRSIFLNILADRIAERYEGSGSSFEIDPDLVRPTIAYLHPQYQEVHEVFSGADLVSFEFQVRAETEEMYGYCRDIPMNIPLDKHEFPLIEDDRICAYCNYRGICFPETYAYDFQST